MKAVICGSDYHLADFGAVPPPLFRDMRERGSLKR